MRTLIIGVLVLVTGITLGVVGWEVLKAGRGPRVHVLLDERAGLERGDPVYWQDVEIGRVEDVALERGRVRVTARLAEEHAESLTTASTFKVETKGVVGCDRRLAAHVLDPNAPPIEDDSTIEGVDSSLELALRTGALRASEAIERVAQSEWVKHGARTVEAFRYELETTDWDRVGRDLEQSFAEVGREFAEMSQQSGEQANETMRDLQPKIDQIAKELEAVTKSEEAHRLHRSLLELWHAATADHAEPPSVPGLHEPAEPPQPPDAMNPRELPAPPQTAPTP